MQRGEVLVRHARRGKEEILKVRKRTERLQAFQLELPVDAAFEPQRLQLAKLPERADVRRAKKAFEMKYLERRRQAARPLHVRHLVAAMDDQPLQLPVPRQR